MTLKWLWILVIAFSLLEWISIPFIGAFTGKLYQLVDGVLIITFIIYPLFFMTSLLLLQKEIKKIGAVILLIPLIVYAPLLISLQTLLK
ncbi:hypothetical protein ABE61_06730 [Lysinibacillus sphaericus]|uniref:hypothetical protein n=1 Tax=Lysinibacillus sphaericus TaxID=1421 RepID=UPI0018CDFB14|nr:hypothetical protein [Lysinibacillus sphaericus]MBG9453785.1 hypothetical protein [Lysinibacillus sphaericus]MBG9476255.1 hypothetical protein [Lysinibacillus sphaericus]MBG9591669.1 hypothetical protein [Lysinibacillus sphaericus]